LLAHTRVGGQQHAGVDVVRRECERQRAGDVGEAARLTNG